MLHDILVSYKLKLLYPISIVLSCKQYIVKFMFFSQFSTGSDWTRRGEKDCQCFLSSCANRWRWQNA